MRISRVKNLVLNKKYYIIIIIICLSSCKTPKIILPVEKKINTEFSSCDTIVNNIIENKELTRQQRKALKDFYSFQIDILQKENKELKTVLKNQRKEKKDTMKYEIKMQLQQQQSEIKSLKEKNRAIKQKTEIELKAQKAAYKHIENQLKEERKKSKKKNYLIHFIASILINLIFLLLFIKKILI